MSFKNSFQINSFKIQNKDNNNIESKEAINNISNKENKIIDNLDIIKLKEINSNIIEIIFEEKYDIALDILKKLEIFLEANAVEPKYNLDKKTIIIVLHNIACCYQKMKDYTNCIEYLDAVIYNFNKIIEKKHNIEINEEYFIHNLAKDELNYSHLGEYILELRFSAKFHLQMCCAFSQTNRHFEALKQAKLSLLICEDNIIKTYYLFNKLEQNNFNIDKNKKKENNKIDNDVDNDLDNPEKMKSTKKILNHLYKKVVEIRNNLSSNIKNNYESYLAYRNTEIKKYDINRKILLKDIKVLLGNEVKTDDWIQLLNIENIVNLSALSEDDLDLDSDPKYEILRDAILEKIVMLTVSFFCVSMEMNILCQNKNDNKTNGEFYLYHAILISENYLPLSCPLARYYINSYYKIYGKDLDTVPEGKLFNYNIELIRNDIESNKNIETFLKMKKINYSNNNNKEIEKNENKRTIIPLDLKLNFNFSIINNNLNNTRNDITNIHPNKFTITNKNDNKRGNLPTFINIAKTEENKLFFNNNDSEKTRIKDLPKFKLNFNKINNIASIQPKSTQINSSNINIHKISTKIQLDKKVKLDFKNLNLNYKYNIDKNIGYKTERAKSNKRTIDIDEILTKKILKEKGRNNYFISFSSNKFLSKTSRDNKKFQSEKTGKNFGNLTERLTTLNNKHKKLLRENIINFIDKINKKQKAGYKTQRELTHFKNKKIDKLKLGIITNDIKIINNKNMNILKNI